ncbi:hypothetical protein LEP1GSC172_0537 [Leptospira noguchii]|uniref:Uncharacterized protein n=2 Tax=Leptospira noguchii TaxID=28182 RepID=T0GUE1_9LEPT|nr:hypothetical protein LEP1GSC172_0537 [Leptospira noguchii]EQA70966.1 hypothetical protein LEP1GSC059_3173 [Leptospira noguchii serovar Panama str. CZ214]
MESFNNSNKNKPIDDFIIKNIKTDSIYFFRIFNYTDLLFFFAKQKILININKNVFKNEKQMIELRACSKTSY